MRWAIIFFVLSGCGLEPAHRPPASLSTCTSPTLAPTTSITSLTERINQLPPSSPVCLLASLPRPLQLVASSSITSAQPAPSRDTPRLFLIGGDVALSFVPGGDGVHLVEFGQWMSKTRTLKGELELPRADDGFALDAPLTRVRFNASMTTCGLCHRDEQLDSNTGGYTSLAFRPARETLVNFADVVREHELCTRTEDASERCLYFHALFDFGEVKAGTFDAEVSLFSE
ncbi:MAG: hypothetical protein QM817_11160 [Archangium sp.]